MQTTIRPSTRDAIIEAAFDIFSRDPSASLSEIADRAGVGRATLHRHFASRSDLLRALTLIAIREIDNAAVAACNGVPTHSEALRQMLTALIPLGDRYWFLANEPEQDDPELADALKRQNQETRRLVEEAKKEGLFSRGVPTAWIAQAITYLLYAAWDSVKAGDATPAQATDLAWRTLTRGLGETDK